VIFTEVSSNSGTGTRPVEIHGEIRSVRRRGKVSEKITDSYILNIHYLIQFVCTCVLKQESEKPRRKLVNIARYLFDSERPVVTVR